MYCSLTRKRQGYRNVRSSLEEKREEKKPSREIKKNEKRCFLSTQPTERRETRDEGRRKMREERRGEKKMKSELPHLAHQYKRKTAFDFHLNVFDFVQKKSILIIEPHRCTLIERHTCKNTSKLVKKRKMTI